MSEVKRDVCHGCVSLPRDTNCPVCDPDIGWRKELDAQRLRADKADGALEVANRTLAMFADDLQVAEQRIAEILSVLQMVKENAGAMEEHEWERIDAALNPNPEAESHE